MKYIACVLLLGSIVHIDSLNPRSVNVALETVLEFDGKHTNRDVKAIDKLQNYLSRIKKILYQNDDSRRHLTKGYKFRDFLKNTLGTLALFDDNELLDVVAIANSEIRKYHYKGCKFHELVENQNMRRDMAERLVNLNELTAKELRAKMHTAIKTLENDFVSEKTKKMLDYLDSVYVGEDISNKMELFLAQLDQFKERSKRANLNLVKVINNGLRSIIFDYYTSLNDNARAELRVRLENFWQSLKSFDSVKQDEGSTTPPSGKHYKANIEISYPKKDILRSKTVGRKIRKKNKFLDPLRSTDVKKYRKTTPEAEEEETVRKSKRYLRKNKKDRVKRLRKATKSTTTLSSPENVSPTEENKLESVKDSIEYHKSRLNKHRKKLREYSVTEPILKVLYKVTRRSNDYEVDQSDEGLHIQSFKKPRTLHKNSGQETPVNTDETITTQETTVSPQPNVVHRIDKIEKVLDEIKNIVSMQNRRRGVDDPVQTVTTTPVTETTERTTVTTTTKTTELTTPATKSTTTTTTEKIETKPIIVEEFKRTTAMNNEIKAKASEEETKIPRDTTTTTNKPTKADVTTQKIVTMMKMTTLTPEIKTTTKPSGTLASQIKNDIQNDTQSDGGKLRSQRQAKESKEDSITDLDIERMFNETRRSGFGHVLDKDVEEDKEMNRRINQRIAGHMKKMMKMTPPEGPMTKFDFSLHDPFGFKDDIL